MGGWCSSHDLSIWFRRMALCVLFFRDTLSSIRLILSYLILPRLEKPDSNMDQPSFTDGMKEILRNRSAISCLLSSVLRMASFQLVLVYSASYLRQEYLVSRELTSILVTGSALSFTLGSLVSGRVVKMGGGKRVAYSFLFLAGIFLAVFTSSQVFWVSLLAYFLGPLCFGVSFPAGVSLFMAQVPEFKGTMMSFTSAFNNVGSALGAGIGGYILLNWGYVWLGLVLGLLGVLASLIVFFFVDE